MKFASVLMIASSLGLGAAIAHADSIALKCNYNGQLAGTVQIDYDAKIVTESWVGLGTDTVPAIITSTTIAYTTTYTIGQLRSVIDRTSGVMSKACLQCDPQVGSVWPSVQCEKNNELPAVQKF